MSSCLPELGLPVRLGRGSARTYRILAALSSLLLSRQSACSPDAVSTERVFCCEISKLPPIRRWEQYLPHTVFRFERVVTNCDTANTLGERLGQAGALA